MSFNRRQVVIIAALLAVTGSIYAGGNADDVIEPSELAARIRSGTAPLIVDVRTADEFAAAHIPGAIHISHTELGERVSELDAYKNKEIVVYCRSGRRAELAEAVLLNAGFMGVRDLEGHMLQWEENGYPVE
jgi:rhodanese-related sulfurtransferase